MSEKTSPYSCNCFTMYRWEVFFNRYRVECQRRPLTVSPHSRRNWDMFMLMLRCGQGVEEVAHLTIGVLDFRQRKIIIEERQGDQR